MLFWNRIAGNEINDLQLAAGVFVPLGVDQDEPGERREVGMASGAVYELDSARHLVDR